MTSIDNVAAETHYYPGRVETYLANEIEEPTKPVLQKIRSQLPISPEEKAAPLRLYLRPDERGFPGTDSESEMQPRQSSTMYLALSSCSCSPSSCGARTERKSLRTARTNSGPSMTSCDGNCQTTSSRRFCSLDQSEGVGRSCQDDLVVSRGTRPNVLSHE